MTTNLIIKAARELAEEWEQIASKTGNPADWKQAADFYRLAENTEKWAECLTHVVEYDVNFGNFGG